VREATAVAEATRVVAVFAIETSAQKAAAAWDSTALHVKDAEDRAALAEREAWERVSRVEVENAVVLASAQEDVEGLVWKITFLEGEIAEERRAWELVKDNSHGLSIAAVDVEHRWEVSKREHREQFEELIHL
jgi:hypothetical protein